jgi:TrmH family RNA methyltransferase
MGAFFTVPCVQATTAEFLAWKAAHGAVLTGAALDPRATDYRAARYAPPALLMVGNEAQGLPEELKAACEQLVIMPMRGRADSLNVAMAGTLLLYEALHWQEGR